MKVRRVGPYSNAVALAKVDGRTREAALMRRMRQELTEHVGGQPSATQRVLIERCVNLTVRLAIMDARFAETGAQADHDARMYLAWSNTVSRMLRQLGLKCTPSEPASLVDYLKARPDQAAA